MERSHAKELAQRLWEEGWNQGRLEVVDEVLAADAVDRHQHHGDDFRGHLKEVIREFRSRLWICGPWSETSSAKATVWLCGW